MIRPTVFLPAALAALLGPGTAAAQFTVYTDKAAFLTTTGAADATGPLPDMGTFIGAPGGAPPGPETTVGSVTFRAVRYNFFDYSARLPGNELGVSFGADGAARESLDILAAGPVTAMGFDFVEPRLDPNVNAPFVDSTFTVTAKSGAAVVYTFTFNAPDDTAAFVGVSGATSFDRLEIRETVGDDENEFFGRVYTTPVPEPAGLLLLAAATAGGTYRGRRAAYRGFWASR